MHDQTHRVAHDLGRRAAETVASQHDQRLGVGPCRQHCHVAVTVLRKIIGRRRPRRTLFPPDRVGLQGRERREQRSAILGGQPPREREHPVVPPRRLERRQRAVGHDLLVAADALDAGTDAVELARRTRLGGCHQLSLGRRRRHPRDGAHLAEAQPALRECLLRQGKVGERLGDPHMLTGGVDTHAALPGEPLGAGPQPVRLPPARPIKLDQQPEERGGCRRQVPRQRRDLILQRCDPGRVGCHDRQPASLAGRDGWRGERGCRRHVTNICSRSDKKPRQRIEAA